MSGDGDLSRRFIEFSTEVTAFSAFDLHGTGHAEIYRSVVTRVVGKELLTDLFDAFDRAVADSADGDAQARARALAAEVFSDDKLGAIARNIIKLWYAGIWYELPDDWTDTYGALPNDGTFTASPQAYPEALLWRAVGSNPPGAKAPGYGSWAFAPVFPPIPGEETSPAARRAAPFGLPLAAVPSQRGAAAEPLVTDQTKETAQ
jgi:hypothetical protein